MKVTSKRRRTKQEILEQKSEELKKQRDIAEKMRDFDNMAEAIRQAEQRAQNNQAASDTINQMIAEGII